MKKLFLFVLFALLGVQYGFAQTFVKGDMDGDGNVTVGDVSHVVAVANGSEAMEVIDLNPYRVDNSAIVGTWYKTKLQSVTFSAEGTTDFLSGSMCTYAYKPSIGKIILYKDGVPASLVEVVDVSAEGIILTPYGSNTPVLYTKSQPTQPVTSVSLSSSAVTLEVGLSTTLTSTVLPSDADNRQLEWTSSNPSVATVSDGVVQAVASGSAVITATTTDGSHISASCTVTVPLHVAGITLSSTSLSLATGNTATLTATVTPSNADNCSVTWTSSDPSVATVSSTGLVTALSTGSTTITCEAQDGSGVTATCSVTVSTPVTSITLDKTSLTLDENESYTLTATVTPSNADNKALSWSSSDDDVVMVSSKGKVFAVDYGTATITCEAQDGSGVTATCSVKVEKPLDANGHEFVDLGLSVKWATCNVGASTLEAYGDYYAWGETSPQSSNTYSWTSYKWCTDGSSSKMTKYSTNKTYWDSSLGTSPDGKTELELADDAAYANWGGDWRMPTDAQWIELLNTDNCTWSWDSTKKGYTVTSKVSGHEGNSIFLPAAGHYIDSSLRSTGSGGYYWSRSLNSSNSSQACDVLFDSSSVSRFFNGRYLGQSVRPVLGSQN